MSHPVRRATGLAVFLLSGCLLAAGPGVVAAQDPPQVADGILVRFTDDFPVDQARRDLAAAGLEPTDWFAPLQLHRCRLVDSQDIRAAVQGCQAHPAVQFVEPDYLYTAFEVPDDPRLAEQWALHNPDHADIDATQAWEVETGKRRIIVAVVDTGLDPTHPDLRDNLWRNPGETGDGRETNGRDDDHNGYVDDVYGWDFVANAPLVRDDNGHGTHVAGIIAARGNNGVGTCGVAWETSLMPVRFLNAQGVGRASDAIAAILYAAANGARILNASWGGSARSQALEEAFEYARRHKVLVIAAAGNAGQDNDLYPTYPADFPFDNILSIAATDRDDHLAPFSNFGAQRVDLAAPGVDILAPFPGGTHRLLSGTSMAAPHVSGVAALVLAHRPGITWRQVMIRLVGGAEPLASLAQTTRSGARLNAYGALSNYPRVAFVHRVGAADHNTPGTRIQVEATDDDPLRVVLHYNVNGGEMQIVPMQRQSDDVFQGVLPLQPPGSLIEYFVRAVDPDGNSGLSVTRRFVAGEQASEE